jgi:putative hydrolase of the HAD superfamily
VIHAVLFDFGGVIAEEGFREGLMQIGRMNDLHPHKFYQEVSELAHHIGYVTGEVNEADFWKAVRQKAGIMQGDNELREEILHRFVLRPDMLHLVQRIRSAGYITAILSDQTNWLEEIEKKTPFSHFFHFVFNSYTLHKSKRDPGIFPEVCSLMNISPSEALLIDDNESNILRARSEGLETILYSGMEDLRELLFNVLHIR